MTMPDELAFPPERDLPAGRLQQRKAHLLREITQHRRPPHSRYARRVLVLVAAASVAGGAYAATRTGDTRVFDAIGCYRDDNINAQPAAFAPANGDSPTAQCAGLWREGRVGPTNTPPPLIACYRSGEVTVIPAASPAICQRLRLAALPRDYAAQVSNERSLEEALTRRLSGCPSAATARRAAEEVLAGHGRSSWRVMVSPPDRYSGPCTNTFGVEQANGRPTGVLVLGQTIRPIPHPTPSQERSLLCNAKTTGTRRLLDNIDCELLRRSTVANCISIDTAVQIAARQLSLAKLHWRITVDHYTSTQRCFSGLASAPTERLLTIITEDKHRP
jgi:hypothetical protein